ncbi:MAG: hypothetical protein RMN51_08960 [Verrucomicrobiota bacterium]|nr:hypothetical protein [Limisphaera sp.]MDW8382220.1 hypothetical protein [Verrucomicrobiota bacterium]
MIRLDADQLKTLGAPSKAGAQQIEDWLRKLLKGGTLRLKDGLVELRSSRPVVTTLGDLKRACEVAVETVKQGLRPLELEHQVLLVDGMHTRLLGPPRFRVSVSRENLSGSVGRAIQVAPMDGLNPLESVDYDQLHRPGHVRCRKPVLAVEKVVLQWQLKLRLADGREQSMPPQTAFLLAAGSRLLYEGRYGLLEADCEVRSAKGREILSLRPGRLLLADGCRIDFPSRTRLQLESINLIRLRDGATGLLEVVPQARLNSGELVEWEGDSAWLGRFADGVSLILLRRAVVAELTAVVSEACAGVGQSGGDSWRLLLGVHDCFLDASIPFRSGRCSMQRSAQHLLRCLESFTEATSLREEMARQFGCTVHTADVRVSPTRFASGPLRDRLRQLATDSRWNSEWLTIGHKVPCWTQVGAYYARDQARPWEVTREVYFTFVDMHYQQSGESLLGRSP